MSLKKAVFGGSVAWAICISVLHAGLNLGAFKKAESTEQSFKVGFLPVT
ncbi:MAG TPA: hypothetical protein VNM14_25725 [Planctomycetota bacterium]|jgi:hypothetical protein|nr:hypothetical protein [Planctomycetota bacterium]